MLRVILALAVVVVCLGFTPGLASAQLFRRAATCPTCPNGVCQPQPSGPMFLQVPATPPAPLPAAAAPPAACFPAGSPRGCQCSTGCNCTSLPPKGPGYYVCPRSAGQACPVSGLPPLAPVASLVAPAGSCTVAPSRWASGEAWRPGCRVAKFVHAHRPHLIFR